MELSAILKAVIALIVTAGAIGDIKGRRIPNWLCVALAAVAFALALSGLNVWGIASHMAHSVLALLVGIVLFGFGWIGAGDAKFYAASALAFPLSKWVPLLGWTSLAGLILIILMSVARKRLPRRKNGKSAYSVPYGVAIAGGCLIGLLSYS